MLRYTLAKAQQRAQSKAFATPSTFQLINLFLINHINPFNFSTPLITSITFINFSTSPC
jgi:hypothetical protein